MGFRADVRGYGRLAADLPHFIFVILAVLWVALVGYFIFGVVGAWWHESLILNRALDKAPRPYLEAISHLFWMNNMICSFKNRC